MLLVWKRKKPALPTAAPFRKHTALTWLESRRTKEEPRKNKGVVFILDRRQY